MYANNFAHATVIYYLLSTFYTNIYLNIYVLIFQGTPREFSNLR